VNRAVLELGAASPCREGEGLIADLGIGGVLSADNGDDLSLSFR
jgi:hypothetical protein